MPTVLVTGSSRGIGLETALAFARAGYQVFATASNSSSPGELSDAIGRERLSITVVPMNVDNNDSVTKAERQHRIRLRQQRLV